MLEGCSEHNLKDLDLRIPLGLFTVVTGVSGSGWFPPTTLPLSCPGAIGLTGLCGFDDTG